MIIRPIDSTAVGRRGKRPVSMKVITIGIARMIEASATSCFAALGFHPLTSTGRAQRQVAINGLPSSTSAMRSRVPGVVPSGNAALSKKPHSTISRLGSGTRCWLNRLTT